MNVPFYIARKISSKNAKSFARFITRLCIAATAVSVCVMVLSTALLDGFKGAITSKFYNCWGHIHIMNFDATGNGFKQSEPLPYNDTLYNAIQQDKNIEDIQAFGIQSIVLKNKTGIQGLLLKGITKDYTAAAFKPFMASGNFITFSDTTYSRQIMLSTTQASKLSVKAGDSIVAYFVQEQGEAPRARKLQVSGIYQTGLQENDKLFAIADLKLIHKLNNDSINNIFGYEVKVKDLSKIQETKKLLQKKYVQLPLNAYTIQERFSYIYQWLQLVEQDLNIIYIIMLIVAIINIISAIIILILERTQMIGILKSLGSTNNSIRKIFVYQSLYISGIGIAMGVGLALLLGAIQQYYPIVKLDPKVYYVSSVQISFTWYKVAAIALGTFVVTGLLLIIPTIITKRITPLKALKFD